MDIDPLPVASPLTGLIMAAQLITVNTPTAGSIIALVCAAIALLISGFVSGSEIAYFSLTPSQREELDESPKGATIEGFLQQPQRLLATILIANNLVNVTIVVLCNFALGPVFANMSPVLSFVLQTVIL
ncbi:MAG: DUF21 domain-containing protein, partial [Muribaculum sp.]|nr:DUF21 domain-containing protein [Muribaculum sp.]